MSKCLHDWVIYIIKWLTRYVDCCLDVFTSAGWVNANLKKI